MSKAAMEQMANSVLRFLPKDFGFVLLVFPFYAVGVTNYVSNANRQDVIKALREAANSLESEQDFETPENNIY